MRSAGSDLMLSERHGFTLLELMLIVAIIAIIAAIAIPSLLRNRIQANESSAIGSLHSIVSAETCFHSGNSRYTGDITELTDAVPAYLDGDWEEGVIRSGYAFVLAGDDNGAYYKVNADTANFGVTGTRNFFVDASGVIRVSFTEEPADAESPPLTATRSEG
ncbi:MAG: prepilin-type N-terminal cleavage/methylation domain-containing protein [Candidatus Hydrogenedentes bacterium]|nr:prepilin-type N-terminal cleavage/methylation domain-containing protein [Candidatus Hydrogenedentota bacterium]